MNAFWGADTEALRTMGTVFSRRAEALADIETLLTSSIDGIEWIGEDADRFRADWSGIVRPSLQDQEVELRQRARRLTQHADEQEAASAPEGPLGGIGGGGGSGAGDWSSPGDFLRDVLGLVEEALRGAGGSQDGSLAELLREVLSTPEGRGAFLGAFLGSAMGGLLADMIRSAIGMGLALENLLSGLGPAGGLGNLIGESGQITPQESLAAETLPAAGERSGAASGAGGRSDDGGPAGGDSAAAGGGESVGGSGSGASGGGSGSGGSSGGSGGSGGGSDGAGADSGAGAEGGSERAAAEAPAGGGPRGFQGLEHGPAQSAGSGFADRITNDGEQGPRSLLERLLEMLGDAITPDTASGSVIGDRIGHS